MAKAEIQEFDRGKGVVVFTVSGATREMMFACNGCILRKSCTGINGLEMATMNVGSKREDLEIYPLIPARQPQGLEVGREIAKRVRRRDSGEMAEPNSARIPVGLKRFSLLFNPRGVNTNCGIGEVFQKRESRLAQMVMGDVTDAEIKARQEKAKIKQKQRRELRRQNSWLGRLFSKKED